MSSPHRIRSTDDPSTSPDSPVRSFRHGRWIVLLAIVTFLVLRVPSLVHAPGGQDEEWYGVPGLTIAQEGIPRVPYSRASDQGSVFLGAEEILFAQPPLSFYAQSPFFLCMPGSYATARVASFLAACMSIVLTYMIACSALQNQLIAGLSALLYSFSRLCFFPALVARPDMICGTLGLAAVLWLMWWRENHQRRWLVAAGVAIGLAALTHPFALVFGIQAVVWVAFTSAAVLERIKRLALLSTAILLTFCLWLPLIVQRPDLFESQFVGNILRPAGPGLLSRAVMPWESFVNQIPQLVDRAHPIQFGMLAAGWLISAWIGWRHRDAGLSLVWMLATSSIYLLVVCLGIHPIQGFWCYTAALSWICFAASTAWILDRVRLKAPLANVAPWAVWALIVAAMVPGSGIRTTFAYLRHWGDPEYMSLRFVRSVLEDIPSNAQITVGPEYSLEVYAEGRKIVLACRHPMYFDSTKHPTPYYLFGRRDFAEGFPAGYKCKLIRSYGNRDDPFANYVELYQGL